MNDRQSSFVIAALGMTALLLSGCGGRRRAAIRPIANLPKPAAPSASSAKLPAPAKPKTPPPGNQSPPIVATLKPYSVDASLSQVANLKSFAKSVAPDAAQRQMLAKQLFVCRSTDAPQLFHIYEQNDYLNVPSFVTADLVLHTYHIFYDYTLRTMEAQSLLPAAKKLTQGMLASSLSDWKSAKNSQVKAAALKNIAFFGVAADVLGMKESIPAAAQTMVEREGALISAHQGFAVGAIFPYNIDYSQFVPRGHYTRSEDLKRYFRAMMWYGLVPFAVHYVDSSGKKLRSDETIRQGLLLARDLGAPGLQKEWDRIYEPTVFYVGAADDMTPAEWESASDSVYGDGGTIDKFADPARLDTFAGAAAAAHAASIQARFGRASSAPADVPQMIQDPAPVGAQLRFMGQRYIPDSAIMQQLAGVLSFPSGLDVMAVLGSDRASSILDEYPQIYNKGGSKEYIPELQKLTAKFASVPPATWRSNLYWSWLDTLRTLNQPAPAGFPSFMKSDAWLDRSIYTSLGSWAELRHDTILYGKQSTAECGGGELEKPVVHGYVEPDVAVYRRLLALTRQSQTGLAARGYLTPELKDHFERFIDLLTFLDTTSEKELRGEKLTESEYDDIRYIGGQIEGLMLSLSKGYPTSWNLVSESDRDMAVVADVHTYSGVALEEGVGHADDILVIVPVDGKLELARGAIFSYYEFKHPAADRMTDEAWRAMLKSASAPPAPVWTKSFLFAARTKRLNPNQLDIYDSGC